MIFWKIWCPEMSGKPKSRSIAEGPSYEAVPGLRFDQRPDPHCILLIRRAFQSPSNCCCHPQLPGFAPQTLPYIQALGWERLSTQTGGLLEHVSYDYFQLHLIVGSTSRAPFKRRGQGIAALVGSPPDGSRCCHPDYGIQLAS